MATADRAWAAGEVNVGGTTEARAVFIDGFAPSLDLQLQPAGRVRLRTRTNSFVLSYSPRLLMRDLTGKQTGAMRWEPIHLGSAVGTWTQRRMVLTLSQDASYGETNATALLFAGPAARAPQSPPGTLAGGPAGNEGTAGQGTAGQGTATGQGAAQGTGTPTASGTSVQPGAFDQRLVETLHYGSTQTQATLTVAPTRTWSYSLHGSFAVSGGLDGDSQLLVPLQRTVSGDVRITNRFARRTDLVSTLSATDLALSGGATIRESHYQLATVAQGLVHRWSRRVESAAMVGLSAVFGGMSGRDSSIARGDPFLEASYRARTRVEGDRVEIYGQLRFSPEVNRVVGTVDTRGQASAGALWRHDDTEIVAGVGGLASIPTDQTGAVSSISADFAVRQIISRLLVLEAGVRATWYRNRNIPLASVQQPGAVPLPDWYSSGQRTIYIRATVVSPSVRF